MTGRHSRSFLFIERILPWLVMLLLGMFTYVHFAQVPNAGFEMANGEVYDITINSEDAALQVGDLIIRIGDITIESFLSDLRLRLFDDIKPGQHIPLVVERSGQTLTIDWIYPGPDQSQFLQRLNSRWWLPYIFWMAGTAALLVV